MAVTEQQPHAIGIDGVLGRDAPGPTRHQVMIAVYVAVLGAQEALMNGTMTVLSKPELLHLPRWTGRSQSLPDVTQQHDLFEVVLQKLQKLHEFIVVVPKLVRRPTYSQMKVRDHCDMHDVLPYVPVIQSGPPKRKSGLLARFFSTTRSVPLGAHPAVHQHCSFVALMANQLHFHFFALT